TGERTPRTLRRDDDLPQRAALTDVRERLRHVVEPDRAVDVDADLARHAQVGQRLEVAGALLDRQYADPAPGRPARDDADREQAQQRAHRTADAPVAPAAGEGPAVGEHRPVGDEVE